MQTRVTFHLGWLVLLAVLLSGRASPGDAAEPSMAIEQLYSVPSIIGTSPEGYAWSRDGTKLAFLWNDTGHRFRDVWVYDVRDGSRRRMTTLAQGRAPHAQDAGISEVAWLTDGRRLAFVLDGRLHLLDASGTVLPVDPERAGVGSLRLAPDGRHLAFLAEGSLWVRNASAGQDVPARREIVADEARVFVERYEWSRDGTRIMFVQADSRAVRQLEIPYIAGGQQRFHRTTRAFPGDPTTKRRVGVHELAAAQTRWLERPDEMRPIWGFGLSADGNAAFVDSSDFLIKERTIDVYDVRGGTSQVYYTDRDPKRVMPRWGAAWAPKDAGLIILSDHGGWFHLYHQARAGAQPRQLTSGNWEIHAFEVDARRGLIYFQANEAHVAERQLYRIRAAGGALERLTRASGTHAPVLSPQYTHAADRFSSDDAPPDLFMVELGSRREPVRVTRSPLPAFDQLRLAEVSYVQLESHVDGAPLVGRLLRPRGFEPTRRYPLIMGTIYPNNVRNQWGGGTALPTWGLDQHLVDRGYLVFSVDVRGSWGHGRAMREKLFHDFGGIDVEDIESGARHLIAQGYVDPARVGIWGWSYGGLMTLMSLYKKPRLYAAGYADAPASNIAHAFPEQMWIMGPPEGADFPARYESMSPLYHTARLTQPLLITHATRDDRVLYADTIALTERLIADGRQFELASMPGSSHVWANDSLEQLRFGYRKMVEFFDRHLRP